MSYPIEILREDFERYRTLTDARMAVIQRTQAEWLLFRRHGTGVVEDVKAACEACEAEGTTWEAVRAQSGRLHARRAEVFARLRRAGWGSRRLARAFLLSRHTVDRCAAT